MQKNIRNDSLSSNTLNKSGNINRPTTIGYSLDKEKLIVKRDINAHNNSLNSKNSTPLILDNDGFIPNYTKKSYTKSFTAKSEIPTVQKILDNKYTIDYPKVDLKSTINYKKIDVSVSKSNNEPQKSSISNDNIQGQKNSNTNNNSSHLASTIKNNTNTSVNSIKSIDSAIVEKSNLIKHKEQFTPKHKPRQNDVSPSIFFNICFIICFVLSIWFPVSHILSNLESTDSGFSKAVSNLKNILKENSAIAVVLELDEFGNKNETISVSNPSDSVATNLSPSEKELKEAIERELLIQAKVDEYIAKINSQISSERPLYVFPLDGPISSTFSWRSNPFSSQTGEVDVGAELEFHAGLDISAAISDDIVAFADGVVSKVAKGPSYGNYILLDHDGFQTLYAHCEGITAIVGQYVKAGDSIAVAGSTGRSTAPHLHFEVRIDGELIDPYKFMQELGVIK